MALDNREIKAAIEAGDLPAVKRLLDSEPGLLHQPLPQGLTPRQRSEILRYRPLTYAAVLNRTETLDYLLARGGDALEYGNFPMCRAALYNRCVPAMEILLAHGADVDGVGNDYGPPLIFSCEGAALDTMAWLLEHGARIAGSGPGLSRTVSWDALKHATSFNRGCPGMLDLLLQHGAEVDSGVEDPSAPGATALHGAAARGDLKGVKVLLRYGADPRAGNADGKRPAEVTRNKKVRELLEKA